jgi:transposase
LDRNLEGVMKVTLNKPGWDRAVFRYGVVSQVEAFVLGGLTLAEAIKRTVKSPQATPLGGECNVSRASLYRWYSGFKKNGIDGLFDERPSEKWTSSLPQPFLKFLEDEKNKDSWASIPEIIRRAERLHIIGAPVDRTTAWHAARKMNLPMFRKRKADETAMRPFAYAHRLQMVLCDGKHFRAGPGRAKRVCFFFLDDATRYALYAIVGFSENSALFLRGFFELICRHGLISALYLDKGPGFIAKDAARVCTCLNIPIIHGRTRYPQGPRKSRAFQ